MDAKVSCFNKKIVSFSLLYDWICWKISPLRLFAITVCANEKVVSDVQISMNSRLLPYHLKKRQKLEESFPEQSLVSQKNGQDGTPMDDSDDDDDDDDESWKYLPMVCEQCDATIPILSEHEKRLDLCGDLMDLYSVDIQLKRNAFEKMPPFDSKDDLFPPPVPLIAEINHRLVKFDQPESPHVEIFLHEALNTTSIALNSNRSGIAPSMRNLFNLIKTTSDPSMQFRIRDAYPFVHDSSTGGFENEIKHEIMVKELMKHFSMTTSKLIIVCGQFPCKAAKEAFNANPLDYEMVDYSQESYHTILDKAKGTTEDKEVDVSRINPKRLIAIAPHPSVMFALHITAAYILIAHDIYKMAPKVSQFDPVQTFKSNSPSSASSSFSSTSLSSTSSSSSASSSSSSLPPSSSSSSTSLSSTSSSSSASSSSSSLSSTSSSSSSSSSSNQKTTKRPNLSNKTKDFPSLKQWTLEHLVEEATSRKIDVENIKEDRLQVECVLLKSVLGFQIWSEQKIEQFDLEESKSKKDILAYAREKKIPLTDYWFFMTLETLKKAVQRCLASTSSPSPSSYLPTSSSPLTDISLPSSPSLTDAPPTSSSSDTSTPPSSTDTSSLTDTSTTPSSSDTPPSSTDTSSLTYTSLPSHSFSYSSYSKPFVKNEKCVYKDEEKHIRAKRDFYHSGMCRRRRSKWKVMRENNRGNYLYIGIDPGRSKCTIVDSMNRARVVSVASYYNLMGTDRLLARQQNYKKTPVLSKFESGLPTYNTFDTLFNVESVLRRIEYERITHRDQCRLYSQVVTSYTFQTMDKNRNIDKKRAQYAYAKSFVPPTTIPKNRIVIYIGGSDFFRGSRGGGRTGCTSKTLLRLFLNMGYKARLVNEFNTSKIHNACASKIHSTNNNKFLEKAKHQKVKNVLPESFEKTHVVGAPISSTFSDNGVRWQGKDSKLCDGCKLTDYNCQCSKAQLADKENDSTLKVSQLADDMNETLKVFISLENTSPSPTMLLESLFSLSKKTVKELIEFCNLNSIKYYQQEEPTKGKNKRGSHKDSKGGATNSKKDQLINAIIKFNFEKQKRDASKNKKKRSKSSSTTNDRCKDQDQSNSQKDGNKSTSNSVSTHDYGFGKSLCDSQIKDLWKSKNPNATEMPFKTKWQWLYCPVCDHFFNRDSSAAKNILLLGILHQTADYRPWIYRPLPADIVHIGRVDTT
ncbi:hypothetical protein DFA_09740 [Cavenderia fasciculata]|uniref:Uncharacterized protein n=1 Tax=Cavenderia fasciculata TaxID=261658 RepID=F4Q8G8_CACFS|nr:uncharacterized protein DFA_09740 [Cavenderia fasciculata]EGG16068.1 hypothetical protein DFA_09740 [Cavenderia fasciculata]|eukprot:XP_004352393.1 hypothetical protein DFA_09740 [Cavenderia fasciculata]